MDYRNYFRHLLQTASTNDTIPGLFYRLYIYICSLEQKDQHRALAALTEELCTVPRNGPGLPEVNSFSFEQTTDARSRAARDFLPGLCELLNSAITENVEADRFYYLAWREIRTSPNLSNDLERAMALLLFEEIEILPYKSTVTPIQDCSPADLALGDAMERVTPSVAEMFVKLYDDSASIHGIFDAALDLLNSYPDRNEQKAFLILFLVFMSND